MAFDLRALNRITDKVLAYSPASKKRRRVKAFPKSQREPRGAKKNGRA